MSKTPQNPPPKNPCETQGNNGGGGNGSSPPSSGSDDISVAIGLTPQLGIATSDVLKFDDGCGDCGSLLGLGSISGIGDASVGFAAPAVVGVSIPSDTLGLGDGSGLLSGLL